MEEDLNARGLGHLGNDAPDDETRGTRSERLAAPLQAAQRFLVSRWRAGVVVEDSRRPRLAGGTGFGYRAQRTLAEGGFFSLLSAELETADVRGLVGWTLPRHSGDQ